jgi:hypothetical protein
VSILTYILNIGLVPNQARIVTVINEPEGIVEKPEI